MLGLQLALKGESPRHAVLVCASENDMILDANEEACELYGRSVEELRKKKLSDLEWNGTPDPEQLVSGPLLQAFGFSEPVLQRAGDGTLIYARVEKEWLELHGEAFRIVMIEPLSRKRVDRMLKDGSEDRLIEWFSNSPVFQRAVREQVTGLVVNQVNEDEHIGKEDKLEQGFVRQVIESLPGSFYMIDEENRFILWNKNLENVLGATSQQVRELDPLSIYRDEDRPIVESKVREAFETGEAEIEVDLFSLDGKPYRFHITGKRVEIDGGIYILGSGIDVTERKAALDELNLSHSLLHQLFRSSPVGIVLIDQEETVLDVNPSFEDIFGYTRDEAVGIYIADLITPPSYRHESAQMKKHLETRSSMVLDHESVRQHKDGHMVPVLVGAVPVHVEGEFIAYYVIYVDLTEQKKYEEEIKMSLEEKNVLLREVHHRVKNNLAIVSGLLGLRKFSIDDERLETILTDCEMQIKSMSLVHEKLYESSALSRVDLKLYIEDLIEGIRSVYDWQEEVELTIECENVEININQAIPVALILNELITNAYKHAFDGADEKRINITINEPDHGGRVEIEVEDTGVGLPEDFDLEHLDSMGYTIVRTLIDQLDAKIEFFIRQGTHVYIEFIKKNLKGSSGNLV